MDRRTFIASTMAGTCLVSSNWTVQGAISCERVVPETPVQSQDVVTSFSILGAGKHESRTVRALDLKYFRRLNFQSHCAPSSRGPDYGVSTCFVQKVESQTFPFRVDEGRLIKLRLRCIERSKICIDNVLKRRQKPGGIMFLLSAAHSENLRLNDELPLIAKDLSQQGMYVHLIGFEFPKTRGGIEVSSWLNYLDKFNGSLSGWRIFCASSMFDSRVEEVGNQIVKEIRYLDLLYPLSTNCSTV